MGNDTVYMGGWVSVQGMCEVVRWLDKGAVCGCRGCFLLVKCLTFKSDVCRCT